MHYKLTHISFSEEIQATKDSVAGINERVEGIQLDQEQQQRRAIADWLSPLNFWTKQNDTFDRRQEGTGKWLLDSDEFRDWLSGTGNTLWCPGIRMINPTNELRVVCH